MKNVHLIRSAVLLAGEVAGSDDSEKALTKRARFVYEGQFDSMDGPVEVTKEHIENLCQAYNTALAKLAAGSATMADHPPIQLDHSTSARDTVGRVYDGPLEVGDFEGKAALFGNLRFLGAENVERVRDGRWTHLSLGADLEGAKLNEMTVTPFPAAPKASLLSKGEPMDEKMAALKKHLMDSEKMSEKDADEKLSKLTDKEKDEMSALAFPPPKEDDKGEKEKDSKMAAAKKSFAKLAKGFKDTAGKAATAVSKVQLSAKLNGLRAKGKLTPGEQKEIDLDKLSALGTKAQEFYFETLEKRAPVIMAGVYGRADAESITKLAGDVKGKQMLGEMLEGMQFSKGVVRKLAGMPTSMTPDNTVNKMSMDNIGSDVGNDSDMPTSMDTVQDMSAHLSHVHKMLSEGQHEEAKAHLEKCMDMCKMQEPGTTVSQPGGTEDPAHLSALAENVQTLQNQFNQLVELTTPILGTIE